jgi:hypothetical protein
MTTAVEPRRLWFGLVAAPTAWAAEGLFGWWVGAQICTAWSVGRVRAMVGVFSIVMLAVAIAGLLTGLRNWRDTSVTAKQVERVEFMSFGGVLVSVAFVIGIFWSGLSAVFIDVCGGMR